MSGYTQICSCIWNGQGLTWKWGALHQKLMGVDHILLYLQNYTVFNDLCIWIFVSRTALCFQGDLRTVSSHILGQQKLNIVGTFFIFFFFFFFFLLLQNGVPTYQPRASITDCLEIKLNSLLPFPQINV